MNPLAQVEEAVGQASLPDTLIAEHQRQLAPSAAVLSMRISISPVSGP
jgi:hypothetical protein